ncbi:DUF2293 domain-containing protein [Lichenihabitans sp. Uapishka_5]|uniref:DUF2293 domain-containing protein n=1 Tax=Lichenihabitans sp. Uapishka_5 TaxID=3037302 RepID=UPI0029E8114E|nr:DUF2293 domain-containing protein [Lichenihabitans sp. Uapishka_5]MDX7950016.1 DUF2293 domain-containing protein [Lichenihabitans sp. Uapishka_5]
MSRRPPGRRDAIEAALRHLAPRLPAFELGVVADRALDSRGLATAAPGEAAWLALVSTARHEKTDYDALLHEGYDHDSARFFVRDPTNAALAAWGCRRRVTGLEVE